MFRISKLMSALAFIAIVSVTARAADNIPDYTFGIIKAVESGASSCGVRFVPGHPGTPTPADYLAVNAAGIVIAHVVNQPYYFSVSRPLGGNVHWIEYSMDWLGVYTPGGTVAHANRFTTGGAWQYNYYCRSTPVYAPQFDACIAQGFVSVVVSRLCGAY
jgi:hypothetical protein